MKVKIFLGGEGLNLFSVMLSYSCGKGWRILQGS